MKPGGVAFVLAVFTVIGCTSMPNPVCASVADVPESFDGETVAPGVYRIVCATRLE